MTSTAYGWLMLAGIVVSIFFWSRLARRDDRLLVVYVAALIGAFLGAKIIYLLAEGWRDIGQEHVWRRLATGKSILGGLLGGYAAVEIAKRQVGYSGVTGDWFALIAPIGIMLGRLGCWFQGCCLGSVCPPAWYTMNDAHGVERWPAVPVELIFNALALVAILLLRGRVRQCGRLATNDYEGRSNISKPGTPGLPLPSTGRGNEGEGWCDQVLQSGVSKYAASTPHPGPLPVEGRGRTGCRLSPFNWLRIRCGVRADEGQATDGAHGVPLPTSEVRGAEPSYLLPGQHFHLYLMAYGIFRFVHEFWRDTPRIVGLISGYQIAALAVAGLGLIGFIQRRRKNLV